MQVCLITQFCMGHSANYPVCCNTGITRGKMWKRRCHVVFCISQSHAFHTSIPHFTFRNSAFYGTRPNAQIDQIRMTHKPETRVLQFQNMKPGFERNSPGMETLDKMSSFYLHCRSKLPIISETHTPSIRPMTHTAINCGNLLRNFLAQ